MKARQPAPVATGWLPLTLLGCSLVFLLASSQDCMGIEIMIMIIIERIQRHKRTQAVGRLELEI